LDGGNQRLPEASIDAPTLDCDLEVQFAGNTAHYAHVLFHQVIQGNAHHITGTVPSTLSDFKIDPPTFFTVPIKNDIPVLVDTSWPQSAGKACALRPLAIPNGYSMTYG
jgi:hypothetical protein